MCEYNFDGIVGPTHNYAGLSPGNLASTAHAGRIGNPRAAALQGLDKMRFVANLGVGQAVLPPQPRPDLTALRRLGFTGSDADVLARAARDPSPLLRVCSSSSAMWTANAATVVPASDTEDGRTHVTVANLSSMFHRSLEVATTTRVLETIFADRERFCVHSALPAGDVFADEGAANHARLCTASGVIHLFAYGRSAWSPRTGPARFPARQTLEASAAVARLSRLPERSTLLWQQAPAGIDAGAFHTDVLAVGSGEVLLLHELAFAEPAELLRELRARLGPEFRACVASEAELPASAAVRAYPFNSQLVRVPSGRLAIIAPLETREDPPSRAFLDRVLAEDNDVDAVHYTDVNASMRNGGGPACLRLRVTLTGDELSALGARVIFDEALYAELKAWVERHYRDRLSAADLADPLLLRETYTALDELSQLLQLGSVYDFQRAAQEGRPGAGKD